jgi:ATP synthase F1 delta subunit
MDKEQIIAKRYAQAFLNVFPLNDRDLAAIHQAIIFLDEHEEVLSLLKVPLLDAGLKVQALESYLIDRFELPESFRKLIALLAAQKRSYLIVEVLRCIEVECQERQHIELFTIASSIPLQANDLQSLQQFLAEQTQHTIVYEARHDENLIAGIRMQSAQHLWEYSIRKQLNAVRGQIE